MRKLRWPAAALMLAAIVTADGCGAPLPDGFSLQGRWHSSGEEGLGLYFDPPNSPGIVEITLDKGGSVSLGTFRYSVNGSRSPFTLSLRRDGGDGRTIGDISVTCEDMRHIRLSHRINVNEGKLVEHAVEMERG